MSLSLVAYAASSDEESDGEPEPSIANGTTPVKADACISDDDDYLPSEALLLEDIPKLSTFTLSLPKPKNANEGEKEQLIGPALGKLPMPRSTQLLEEEDDEFLHKKATSQEAIEIEKPPPLATSKVTVKISIPSLKDFSDVDKELSAKASKIKATDITKLKGSGLLNMLPIAKSEQRFDKQLSVDKQSVMPSGTPVVRPAFIPDTVKNQRPAHNTEGVDGVDVRRTAKQQAKKKLHVAHSSGSEASDNEDLSCGDFFSLNKKEQLTEVSANEINAMVAKRAAKMAAVTTKFLKTTAEVTEATPMATEEHESVEPKRYTESQLDAESMQALVGSSAKRRRMKGAPEIQVMDISSDQVLPDREEWLRNALASSTSYQPTGVLTDEEPAAGTRRKHQITYLAHRAKANEAELQAMWATNRQNRRATQSKYGF